jgi:hypothetical protein
MSKRPAAQQGQQQDKPKEPALPIGQHEGEGTNATTHEPDPQAEPLPGVDHKYIPRSGHIQGNT